MKSLFEKPILDGKVRMTQPTLIFVPNLQIIDEHIVNSDEVCRIDLISLEYYKDASFVDFILKYNGISNPFSITEGDVLLIPTNEFATTRFIPFKTINNDDNKLSIRDQFISTKRLSVKDAKRVEYLKRKAALKVNGSKEILPPNIKGTGDGPNIKIGNGKIII